MAAFAHLRPHYERHYNYHTSQASTEVVALKLALDRRDEDATDVVLAAQEVWVDICGEARTGQRSPRADIGSHSSAPVEGTAAAWLCARRASVYVRPWPWP